MVVTILVTFSLCKDRARILGNPIGAGINFSKDPLKILKFIGAILMTMPRGKLLEPEKQPEIIIWQKTRKNLRDWMATLVQFCMLSVIMKVNP